MSLGRPSLRRISEYFHDHAALQTASAIGLLKTHSRQIHRTVSATNFPDPDRLEESPDRRAQSIRTRGRCSVPIYLPKGALPLGDPQPWAPRAQPRPSEERRHPVRLTGGRIAGIGIVSRTVAAIGEDCLH